MVWALGALYRSRLGEHLTFKGGTSLSKAYGVIRRFSEDVDWTYDIRALAPDLVGQSVEALPDSRNQQRRWTSQLRIADFLQASNCIQPSSTVCSLN